MKKALVIFPDEWLRYSPSMLNLIHCLSGKYEVHTIAGDNDHFHNYGIVPHLTLAKYDTSASRIYRKLGKYKAYKRKRFEKVFESFIKNRQDFDLIFAADALAYILAKNHFDHVIYFSLEISRDKDFQTCLELGIDHIVIQSQERFRYLMEDQNVPHTFIQNAPILIEKYPPKPPGKKILYMGNVDYKYGIEALLDGVTRQDGYAITLKGFASPKFLSMLKERYARPIEQGIISFHFDYTPQEEIIEFIRQFDIGVTGYDMELAMEDYNYYSSPAGKLFNYYAAGLPVIGVNIDGLKSVDRFNAGVLLDEVNQAQVGKALHKIEQDYHLYTKNSLKAAEAFDFKKGFNQLMNDINING